MQDLERKRSMRVEGGDGVGREGGLTEGEGEAEGAEAEENKR